MDYKRVITLINVEHIRKPVNRIRKRLETIREIQKGVSNNDQKEISKEEHKKSSAIYNA